MKREREKYGFGNKRFNVEVKVMPVWSFDSRLYVVSIRFSILILEQVVVIVSNSSGIGS